MHYKLNALRSEPAQIDYERPIHPVNLSPDRTPPRHGEYRREVIDRQVELLHELDVRRRPTHRDPSR